MSVSTFELITLGGLLGIVTGVVVALIGIWIHDRHKRSREDQSKWGE
jgi:hypothetical protein